MCIFLSTIYKASTLIKQKDNYYQLYQKYFRIINDSIGECGLLKSYLLLCDKLQNVCLKTTILFCSQFYRAGIWKVINGWLSSDSWTLTLAAGPGESNSKIVSSCLCLVPWFCLSCLFRSMMGRPFSVLRHGGLRLLGFLTWRLTAPKANISKGSFPRETGGKHKA